VTINILRQGREKTGEEGRNPMSTVGGHGDKGGGNKE